MLSQPVEHLTQQKGISLLKQNTFLVPEDEYLPRAFYHLWSQLTHRF